MRARREGVTPDEYDRLLMQILEMTRAGAFGLDGAGRPPGIWPLSNGVRIGQQRISAADMRRIVDGTVVPVLVGAEYRRDRNVVQISVEKLRNRKTGSTR